MSSTQLPVGLALSGGTAKSIAHVGVIKALTEAGVPIDHLAGTSGGGLVAVLYASGMTMPDLEKVANELSWSKLITIRLSRLGFVSSKRIQDFVKDVIGDITFEELNIPCHIVATDLETGHKHIFNSGPVGPAVRASCSIPQIYLPVEIDGKYYVDGGFSEYLPANTLHEIEHMFVIAVNLASEQSMYRRPKNYLQLAIHIMGLVAKTNYLISREKADVLIHPNMDGYSSFDFDTSEELIDVGYNMTKDLIPEIKRQWRRKSSKVHRILQRLSLRD